MKMFRRKGFTLVEIMIVVAIIGLLAAIAIPNFVRARATALENACLANQRQIDGAVQVWAIDAGATDPTTVPPMDSLVSDYIRAWPACAGQAYARPSVGGTAACPVDGSGHEL